MLILGLSSFRNDAAAALMRDGVIEAAIENYKLEPAAPRRIPEAAIQYCLSQVEVQWRDVDLVAIASNPKGAWARKAVARRVFSPSAPAATLCQEGRELGRLARELTDVQLIRQRMQNNNKVITLDHQLCHAASAFFLSPFRKALILNLDGEGDGFGGVVAVGDDRRIQVQETISYSDSIGWLYSLVTRLVGFRDREEYKTQWLGLEGDPVYKELFIRMLRGSNQSGPHLDLRYWRREVLGGFAASATLLKELGMSHDTPELSQDQRRDIASSLQAAMTETISEWLAALQKKYGVTQICLGGGVFQNALLVSSLERRFGPGNIFVPPASGNAGCAPGAAASVWHQQMGMPRNPEVRSVYWGPSFTRQEIKDVLDNVKSRYVLHHTDGEVLDSAVQLLRAGKIVGWFHGATEFGPRALGHRSILASPWAPYVSENLNEYVKHRESFRPYAVSVREEDCARYFEASTLSRFMNSLGVLRPDVDVLPGALQLSGGLVRLHVVEKQTNRLLWELLRQFGQREPAPILVNTSFNLPNEPPVVRPRDAVRTFFCSGIEAVFIDRFLLTKWSAAHVLGERAVSRPERTGMEIANA